MVLAGSMVLAVSMVFYNLLYYVCYCGILIPPVGLNMIPLERRLYTCSSEIFENFDWERVIFIQDVQRTTYETTYAELNYAYQRRTKVTEFSKTFLVFYKWLNLLHSKVCLVIFLCCEHAAWYLLFLSLFCFTSQQYTSSTKIFIFCKF